ncbi:hypothetical protein M5K25_015469 [Dendrobium thyrsiflorum]|uniref:Uncharacterized protein n=1 Tax=Dendrobium thyrsiflorum TaxID=117978 RepID=A0ABD0UR80_DENTH
MFICSVSSSRLHGNPIKHTPKFLTTLSSSPCSPAPSSSIPSRPTHQCTTLPIISFTFALNQCYSVSTANEYILPPTSITLHPGSFPIFFILISLLTLAASSFLPAFA